MNIKAYPFICRTLTLEPRFTRTISKQVFFDNKTVLDSKYTNRISKQVFFDRTKVISGRMD